MAAFNWFQRSYEEPEKPKEEETSDEAEKVEEAPASPEDYLKWAKAAYQNIQERQGQGSAVSDESVSDESASEPDSESTSEPSSAPAEVAASAEEPAVEAPAEAPAAEVAEMATAEDSVSEPVAEPVAELTTESVAEPVAETSAEAATEPAEEVVAAPVEEAPALAVEVAEVSEDAAQPMPEPDAEPLAAAVEEPEPVSEPPSEPPSEPETQPFWAQAQAEREARLQRLAAEAIVEPEPEPKPTPKTAKKAEPKFVPLDIDLDEAFLWSAEVLASQGRRPDQISLEEITWLNKLRQGLDKTRRGLVNQLKAIVGQGPLNDEAVDEIESLLLQADVGVVATDKIISALQARLREETLPPEQAISYLKSLLRDMLDAPLEGGHNLTFTPEKGKLSIWLMTGVNGAGKTTTIGKLTHIAKKSGFECLIGAADTFRAAAVEQVKVWGARSGVEVIANPGQNTDPAAVVFDAISAAQSRGTELLLIDTAGRLQNKKNLMDELSKVRKIIDKKAPEANVESLLVLDATLGQNGLRQAEVFAKAAQLSGVVLTKLDGTARGGVALAVVQQLGLPIRFIGAGEGIEDLRPFSSYEFVEALLNG